MTTREHVFISYLESLTEDRAALAALRRGLGQPPGTVPDTFRYVIPMIPDDAYPGSWKEATYYLISSLFALHPESVSDGNLGDHFAATLDPQSDNQDAVERRFTALLTADPADLHIYLRQGINFLKSKEIPVNWHQLMADMLRMRRSQSVLWVRKRWANAFWRYNVSTSAESATNQSTN